MDTPKKSRGRKLAFTIVVAAILCGPLAMGITRGLQHFANFNLPAWLTVEKAEYLSGGYTPSNLGDHLNWASIADGSFQKAVGVELENSAPCKANTLLLDAAVQRSAIALANAPFGWPCYPTYFDSEQLYIPEADALTYHPITEKDWMRDGVAQLAAELGDFARRYPDKRFVVLAAPGFRTPACNPAYDLVPTSYTAQDFCTALEQGLSLGDGSEGESGSAVPSNICILTTTYEDAEAFYHDFFRTDHHWNIYGAAHAYNTIADAAGLTQLTDLEVEPIEGYEDYRYSGATARWSLDMVSEEVFDLADNFSDVRIVRSDGSETTGADHQRFYNDESAGKNYRFYDSYYDNIGGGSVMYGQGSKDAILVANSYGGALSRMLARQYRTVTLSSALHQDKSGDDSLPAIPGFAEASDIYFVADPYAFDSFCRRMPEFFN